MGHLPRGIFFGPVRIHHALLRLRTLFRTSLTSHFCLRDHRIRLFCRVCGVLTDFLPCSLQERRHTF